MAATESRSGRATAAPIPLASVGKDEALRVGHLEVHRRVPEEMPRIGGDRALFRQQVIERDAKRAWIYVLGGAAVLVGLLAPAPGGELSR